MGGAPTIGTAMSVFIFGLGAWGLWGAYNWVTRRRRGR